MNGIELMIFDRPLAVQPAYARALASLATEGVAGRQVVTDDETTRIEFQGTAAQEAFFDFMFGGRDGDDYELRDGVAIISVRGCLMPRGYWGATYEGIAQMFRSAMDNSEVNAILFDIDSAGGDVAGLFDLVDEIYEARGEKPIWAVASELAASAAYAIGSAADRLYLPRTGEVGSIGVLMLHYDETGAMEKYGVAITPIYSGAHKIDGAWFQSLSPEAKARFQGEVSETYDLFVNTVARNRGVSVEAVRGTEALTYRGQNAVTAGLADEVMAYRDVVDALRASATGQVEADPAANSGRSSAMKTTGNTAAGRRPAGRASATKPKANAETQPNDNPDAEAAEGTDPNDPETPAEDQQEPADSEDTPADQQEPADSKDTPASASAERKRIGAILGSDEGKANPTLANHLAFNTSLSLNEAKEMLKASGVSATAPALGTRMKGRDPQIGSAAPAAADPRVAAAKARYAERHGMGQR